MNKPKYNIGAPPNAFGGGPNILRVAIRNAFEEFCNAKEKKDE